jgi:hypothetical protein
MLLSGIAPLPSTIEEVRKNPFGLPLGAGRCYGLIYGEKIFMKPDGLSVTLQPPWNRTYLSSFRESKQIAEDGRSIP